VEEKQGGDVSVPVEAFEGRNLIFVDEGHKGSGGETWRKYRDALGTTGFTFEYSATFGQALSAANDPLMTAEYAKAIVFDYSYKYFYSDGFGKDFRILNLKDETDAEKTDTLLLVIGLKNDNGIPICTLIADERVLKPQSFADCALLQQAVTQLLCRYLDRFYQKCREQWDEHTMVYRPLNTRDPNLGFGPQGVSKQKAAYVVRIPRSEEQLAKAVQALLREQQRLYEQENAGLPRIHFDRHLYQPLLVDMPEKVQIVPPGLRESEARFVRDLREYWNAEKDKSLAGKEVFLLRNLSRGYGIGFFEERGFYPDFILWVVDRNSRAQRIVFIEPHGMLHANAYIHDEKARLWERLPGLAKKIGKRSRRNDISLDAFIVSATPYDELYRRYDDGTWDRAKFAKKHILFQERGIDYDYMEILLGRLTSACT